MSLKNKDKIIKELQEANEKLRKEKEVLEKKKEELEKQVKDLEVQLSFFKNPHTPPSKQIFRTRISQTSKKLGAPLGHKGATREVPEPDKTVKYFLTKCPKCKELLGKPFDVEERIIEEIPEPQPVRVTKHLIGFYDCKNCGIIQAEANLPKEGNLGKNVLAHTSLMKYDDR